MSLLELTKKIYFTQRARYQVHTHTIMAVFAVALTFLPVALADPHPTLPTMWRATTKEDEVGVVFESENFVDDHEITENNPDAKWTNYTGIKRHNLT